MVFYYIVIIHVNNEAITFLIKYILQQIFNFTIYDILKYRVYNMYSSRKIILYYHTLKPTPETKPQIVPKNAHALI